MNAFAILLLASLPVSQVQLFRTVSPQASPHFAQQAKAPARKGGQWYFARTGHAVYCYGPVMTLPNQAGDIERVATFCKGNQLLVPLKD
jgi:hypothetical protein